MSHYTVAVITNGEKDLDEILAPYDENIEVAPYIGRTKKKMIEEAKEIKERILERMREKEASGEKYEVTDFEKPYLEAKTDEDFYKTQVYDDAHYTEDGDELTTYNPNSKWDWYVVGGRWDGLLKAKEGFKGEGYLDDNGNPAEETWGEYDPDDRFNCLKIKDIDFSPDKDEYDNALAFWKLYIEDNVDTTKDGRPLSLCTREYYLNRYTSKEDYAEKASSFITRAVITPDGVWHEPGQMGWFGLSSESDDEWRDWAETYKEKFIDNQDPENYMVIVDCHI